VTCRIIENGKDTVPDFVASFDWEQSQPYDNPSVQINDLATEIKTPDKSLDSLTYRLDIECVSDLSESSKALAVTQLNIKFHDECFDTVIRPAQIANGEAYLHTDFSLNWMLSQQNLDCPEIYYYMDLDYSDAFMPYQGFQMAENYDIIGLPTSRAAVGKYYF